MRGHEAEALTCRFGAGCRQGLNCPYRHSQEEIQIFVDERDLRRRKLMVRCGFCVRGECKFEGCCARTIRAAAASEDQADSDYESGSADSEEGDIGLAGEGVSDEDDGWLTQSSKGGSVSSDERAWGDDDCCSDEGRFAALGAEGREEDSVRGTGLLVDEPDFCFSEGTGRVTRRGRAAEKKTAAAAAAARDEAVVAAALAEVEDMRLWQHRGEAKVQTAGARDRARAGWDRVRIAVSELSWRRFRRVFRRKRRVAVEGPVLTVELVGTVLWMAWERARDGWRREREETAEQTAAELAVRMQARVQRRQQEGYSGWETAREYSNEGYYSGDSSDVDHTVGSLLAAQTPERAEVVAAAMAVEYLEITQVLYFILEVLRGASNIRVIFCG